MGDVPGDDVRTTEQSNAPCDGTPDAAGTTNAGPVRERITLTGWDGADDDDVTPHLNDIRKARVVDVCRCNDDHVHLGLMGPDEKVFAEFVIYTPDQANQLIAAITRNWEKIFRDAEEDSQKGPLQ